MSELKMIFVNAVNTFLDTTPRQWIQGVAAFLKDLLIGLEEGRKEVFDKSGGALVLSLMLHASPVVWMWSQQVDSDSSDASVATTLKDLLRQPKAEVADTSESSLIEVLGVYYFNGTEKKKSVLQNTQMSNLLKSLRVTNTAWASVSGNQNKKPQVMPSQAETPDKGWQELAKEQQAREKKSVAGKLDEILSQEVRKYDSQFQSCYEKSLLQDSSMNGKIEFLIQMGSAQRVESAHVRFDGVGLPESKKDLEGCLRTIANKIHFPVVDQENIAGKTLKFFVLLKSR